MTAEQRELTAAQIFELLPTTSKDGIPCVVRIPVREGFRTKLVECTGRVFRDPKRQDRVLVQVDHRQMEGTHHFLPDKVRCRPEDVTRQTTAQ